MKSHLNSLLITYLFLFLEDVYMRPEMKTTRIKISTYHKRNSVYITFYCRHNEMNFLSGWSKINTPLSKSDQFCLRMCRCFLSFDFIFINRNEISILSKWPQWNNARNEFHFGLYHVSSYKKLGWHWNENISIRPKWNSM